MEMLICMGSRPGLAKDSWILERQRHFNPELLRDPRMDVPVPEPWNLNSDHVILTRVVGSAACLRLNTCYAIWILERINNRKKNCDQLNENDQMMRLYLPWRLYQVNSHCRQGNRYLAIEHNAYNQAVIWNPKRG